MSKYLLVSEVAERLRLSRGRVHDLVRDGVLPARRLTPRGRLLFNPADVEAALTGAARPARADGVAEPVVAGAAP